MRIFASLKVVLHFNFAETEETEKMWWSRVRREKNRKREIERERKRNRRSRKREPFPFHLFLPSSFCPFTHSPSSTFLLYHIYSRERGREWNLGREKNCESKRDGEGERKKHTIHVSGHLHERWMDIIFCSFQLPSSFSLPLSLSLPPLSLHSSK